MSQFKSKNIQCPHCQYAIEIIVDTTQGNHHYFDDCPSCHHAFPLKMTVHEDSQEIYLNVDTDELKIF